MRGKKVKALQAMVGHKMLTKADKEQYNAQARTNAAQCPKFKKVRVRKPAAGHGPTWPRTKDQKAQSRPMIYARPVCALKMAMYGKATPNEDGTVHLTKAQVLECQRAMLLPKHAIEAKIQSL
jgi:hypothetical protein